MNATFIAFDGTTTQVEVDEGESLMQAAITNDVNGIVGECGGSMMCATCHCYIDDAWLEAAGPRNDGEEDMLESATSEVRPQSRLSCQVKMNAELDGIVVRLPETQI
ncbi:2Fe-2S iron-sulfur cluster-binding protein [Aquamicrobium zhengzhouense]|uniref:2Fe-2S iron-sulfur cluster binding domain-containing protein n=1 Tax=Aquamicrobium zhengzhouense TaxID=2781738 RepID=A0ABS0SHU5_9HYPH|nr:2Fe-2S iron-sulfur cluster-binding protein [Aquamicrobium zhengzhouense]MBI1622022.1 2Fe-2S iron-sulfur cluster binding domain-containing protein [Aquamicrobium zhengzhouense]